MKNSCFLSVLFLLMFQIAVFNLPVFSEENPKQETAKTGARWTETLRLSDFSLSPASLELKDKINDYKNNLKKEYTEHSSVFSSAVEYGLVLLDVGELKEAKLVWDRAVKDFIGNPVPKVYKGWTDALNGDYVSAKNLWYPIAKEKIDMGITGLGAGAWFTHYLDSVLGLYLIRDNLSEKDKSEVSGILEEISKHFFIESPKLASISVSEDLKSGDVKSAEDKVQKLLINNPEDPIVLTLAGITKLVGGDYKEALKLFNKSEKINPNSPTNQIMRARTLLALNKKKDANKAFEKAVKLDPIWSIEESKKARRLLEPTSYLVRESISSRG